LEKANTVYNLNLEFDYEDVGFASLEKYGTTLRPELLEQAILYDGIILGTQDHMNYPPPDQGGPNVSAGFRVGLDLFANVRPARSRPFLRNKAAGMDLVIMREATEGFYADRNMYMGWGEMMPSEDMAISVRKITAHCSERIARESFDLAMSRRKHVTAIHKVNSFKMTDGLFLREFRKVAADYSEVKTEEILVDAMAAHLVRSPERFDVVCCTNFYGDILSDLASELSGGLGLAGSINAGADNCCAQAQHGSAPDIAGQNKANPTSMILSVGMLLEWMGGHHQNKQLGDVGKMMMTAVDTVLANPETRTADLGGSLMCREFGAAVADSI
ncbi:MAG: isocitrate/isopropylmalate family dehydrogenase, partial [Chloroflexota bacterium]